jgi:ParB-like chromosome segregation protein Spo0J
MPSKKNTACTLKVGEIEKDPILALGTSEKDVEKYGRVAKAYGNVAPAIVGHRGGAYRILAGQARLEACATQGIREMPAIVAETSGEAEQMKLALLLSTVREEGGALSEGAFINALTKRHGVTRRELMGLLKKSKSWMSKRESLDARLSDAVKGMVRGGVVCARTAEEIARMPEGAQAAFADAVVRDGLNKTEAGQLVGLYVNEETGSALREAIMDSPLAVLDARPAGPVVRHKERRGLAERIAGNAVLLIRLIGEFKTLLATADAGSVAMASSHLCGLHLAAADLDVALSAVAARVSPGKPQAGGDAQ